MFKKIIRCLINGGPESKPESTQSKQQGKQNHPRTTPAERTRMLELRKQGQSVHNIAGTMDRSSRTVHQVLTKRGTQPLPDPGEQSGDAEPSEHEAINRRKNHRRRSGGNFARGEEEPADSFLREYGPTLNRLAFEAMKDNEEATLQCFANQYGMKMPKKTVDDIVIEEIKNSPDLKRQVADDYIERRSRGEPKRRSPGRYWTWPSKSQGLWSADGGPMWWKRPSRPEKFERSWRCCVERSLRIPKVYLVGPYRGIRFSPPTPLYHHSRNGRQVSLRQGHPSSRHKVKSSPTEQPRRLSKYCGRPGQFLTRRSRHQCPDAVTIRRFITAVRSDFVNKVDWSDLDAGVQGESDALAQAFAERRPSSYPRSRAGC